MTVGEVRTRLLAVAEDCTGKAAMVAHPEMRNERNADQALAAKNWTAAALSAAQAYKTLGEPARLPAGRTR